MAKKELSTVEEPTFTLRANDETAPIVIRYWAEKYHEAKGKGMSENPNQLEKYNNAYQIARDMEAWKNEQTSKPD